MQARGAYRPRRTGDRTYCSSSPSGASLELLFQIAVLEDPTQRKLLPKHARSEERTPGPGSSLGIKRIQLLVF